MIDKEDIVERITNKLILPHVVLDLMLKSKKVEREQIKASLEDIGQVIKLLENWEKEKETTA